MITQICDLICYRYKDPKNINQKVFTVGKFFNNRHTIFYMKFCYVVLDMQLNKK